MIRLLLHRSGGAEAVGSKRDLLAEAGNQVKSNGIQTASQLPLFNPDISDPRRFPCNHFEILEGGGGQSV